MLEFERQCSQNLELNPTCVVDEMIVKRKIIIDILNNPIFLYLVISIYHTPPVSFIILSK